MISLRRRVKWYTFPGSLLFLGAACTRKLFEEVMFPGIKHCLCVCICCRAPVLVALALIESGMKYEDAIQFIRQ